MQIGLTTAVVAISAALQRRRRLVEASVHCRIHPRVVHAAHLSRNVL